MPDKHESHHLNCRVCGSRTNAFMSFGRMPIANGFLTAAETAKEYFFELAPAFCETCGMFQLVEQPQPDKMFHANYAFYSSTSRYMEIHFEKFARSVMEGILSGRPDPLVVMRTPLRDGRPMAGPPVRGSQGQR